MNVLKIDTSDNLITRVMLEREGNKSKLEHAREKSGDQNVLELISKLLAKHKMKLEDISEIQVKTGPGSFTGLRVGASIANALSFALGIPVNAKPLGENVIPEY